MSSDRPKPKAVAPEVAELAQVISEATPLIPDLAVIVAGYACVGDLFKSFAINGGQVTDPDKRSASTLAISAHTSCHHQKWSCGLCEPLTLTLSFQSLSDYCQMLIVDTAVARKDDEGLWFLCKHSFTKLDPRPLHERVDSDDGVCLQQNDSIAIRLSQTRGRDTTIFTDPNPHLRPILEALACHLVAWREQSPDDPEGL